MAYKIKKIKPLVLQKLRDVIAPVLQVICQRSLNTGRVPKDWSTAFVCPLFKKGDTSLASNYRPISLTSILCKVLEHIVTTNIVSHMDKYNLLYDLQHGFRSKRSCETQLVTLIGASILHQTRLRGNIYSKRYINSAFSLCNKSYKITYNADKLCW